jgi:hypothetical protein
MLETPQLPYRSVPLVWHTTSCRYLSKHVVYRCSQFNIMSCHAAAEVFWYGGVESMHINGQRYMSTSHQSLSRPTRCIFCPKNVRLHGVGNDHNCSELSFMKMFRPKFGAEEPVMHVHLINMTAQASHLMPNACSPAVSCSIDDHVCIMSPTGTTELVMWMSSCANHPKKPRGTPSSVMSMGRQYVLRC